MKAKLNTWMNVLLGALLSLLGYSCSWMPVEYGVPMGDLTYEGTVTNDAQEPLPDIQILHRAGWKDGEGTSYWWEGADTLRTGSDGRFYKLYEGFGPMKYHMTIAHDPSGTYASDSVLSEVTYSGGKGAWDQGEATLDVKIILRKK